MRGIHIVRIDQIVFIEFSRGSSSRKLSPDAQSHSVKHLREQAVSRSRACDAQLTGSVLR